MLRIKSNLTWRKRCLPRLIEDAEEVHPSGTLQGREGPTAPNQSPKMLRAHKLKPYRELLPRHIRGHHHEISFFVVELRHSKRGEPM